MGNLLSREELKKAMFEHCNNNQAGTMVFYLEKSKDNNPFECSINSKIISSNISESDFYSKLSELESDENFLCYIGENHKFILELDEKMNSEEFKHIIEERKKFL